MSQNILKKDSNEKIIDYIAGIMRTGFGFRGYSFLGRGEVVTPENALIITNKRILFIVVSLEGADKIIASTDIPMWQWLIAIKDIKKKLEEIISSLQIQKIMELHPKNFSLKLEDIKKIIIGRFSQSISFITKDDKKYKYAIRNKDDFKKLKIIFSNFL